MAYKYRNKNNRQLEVIISRFDLTKQEKNELLNIIVPIYLHKEFQKRMGNNFYHHSNISLGEHILEDAVQTYKYAKAYKLKHTDLSFELDIAVKIAMLHDLYTEPWQNNDAAKVTKYFNKHGFRHPIEAVINAYTWFPELFEHVADARKIIDGIVHHMYPLPVVRFKDDDENSLELRNYELVDNLPPYIKNILIKSTERNKIGRISLSRSIFLEGRLMAKADKYISMRQIKNIHSATALVTGHNKSLN